MESLPREIALGDYYNLAGGEYLSPDKLEGDYATPRFDRELRLFRHYCPKGSVLDVGCSSGGFLYQLQSRFPSDYQALGTDVSEEPLAYAAQKGVPIFKGDFSNRSFDSKFAAITFWAVMEHLANPKLFLEKAVSILEPGGLCFILVPNMNSLAVRILGGKYRYIFHEHLNYFTPSTLRRFVEPELTVVAIKSTHFNPVVILKDLRGNAQTVSRADRAKLLRKTTAWKESTLLSPIRCLYNATERLLGAAFLADNLVIVARKG